MRPKLTCRVIAFWIAFLASFGLLNTAFAKASLQSTQEAKPATATAQSNQDVRLLEIGKPIEREMNGGETHIYQLNLAAGQFLHVVVEQRGVDVVVMLFEPDGKQIYKVDSPNGAQGPEPVLAIAEISGRYRLEVRSLEKNAKPGRYDARIEELRIASPQDRTRVAGDRAFMEADLLYAKGDAASLRKAIAKYEEALQMRRAVGDHSGEAVTLSNIGHIYKSLGDVRKALEYFNQALPIFQSIADRSGEAITLNNIGTAYKSLGEGQKALGYYNQALPIRRAVGDRSGEATTLNNIGAAYDDVGETQKALEYYNQALLIFRTIGNRIGEAATLNNIGYGYDSLGQKHKALEYYGQALPILRTAGNRLVEASTLNNVGTIYADLGEKQKALEHYTRALPIFRALGYRAGEASTFSNIGGIYDSLGDKQKALEYYNQALTILRVIGNRPKEATSLNNIGYVYHSLGDKQKALEYYNQALPILRAVRNRAGEAQTLNNIGGVYGSLGDKQKALEYYNQALPIRRAIGDRAGEAQTLNNIGGVHNALGDKQKALEYYNQVLLIIRAVGYASGEATTLSNIGAVHESLGDEQKALNFYQQAIAMIEKLRTAATIEEIKTGLSEQSVPTYQHTIPLLMRLGRQTEAFDLTERARARTFLDQMANVRPLQRNTTNPQLIQEEQTLASELISSEQRLRQERSKPASSLNTNELSSIENQLAVKHRRYEDLLLRLKLTNPEYASLRGVNTLTLSQVQKLLNKDTTLISYFVTPEKTLAFIITRGSFRAVDLPVKEAELINSIKWFRGFASLHNPLPETLKQLYSWLIAPLSQYIKTQKVGVIPQGVLHYLPFAALTDGKHYFGDDHTLFYLPSASVLSFIQQKSKPVGSRVLIIAQSQTEGLPVLQYADEEAQVVARLYNTQALTTGKASRSGFLKQAREYSIIHIAAHAELNAISPLFSRIILGTDQQNQESSSALEVREVYELDLSKSSLIVLSACETQLGAQSKGDDIVGLNRAFIYAGTPTVIASLWTVDDESTSYLMNAFYIHLKRGMSKAEALQAAQSETRKKYPHPYYWAGFVLTGDPGPTTAVRAGRN